MKILLAIDGSECSQAALAQALERPWPEGSELKIVTVVEPLLLPMTEPIPLPGDYFERVEDAAQEQARSIIDKALDRFRATPLEVIGSILRGNPKQAILDEAEKWEADLIVVGSHGYRGFTRLWLGSVSQAVASNAHCSVEIVRTRKCREGA
jgi:nucleotide-binding universal stress UspA family protein